MSGGELLHGEAVLLGVVRFPDHDSGVRGELLHGADEISASQSSIGTAIHIDTGHELAGIESVGNFVELVHVLGRGGQPFGVELVVHVVDLVSIGLVQVGVFGNRPTERRNGSHGDRAGSFELRDQSADASGESGAAMRERLRNTKMTTYLVTLGHIMYTIFLTGLES